MKVSSLAWMLAGAAGIWGFHRVRQARRVGVPWEVALAHWSTPLEQLRKRLDCTCASAAKEVGPGAARTRPTVR